MLRHKCNLANAYIPIENQYVEGGICIPCRRKIYNLCMISENHPMAKRHYRSSTMRRYEQTRHLSNHPYVIHPFSMFSLYWEFVYFIAFNAVIILLSITVTDPSSQLINRCLPLKWVVDVIINLDILKNFMTGYYNNETYGTVLKPKYLARHYLITYFLIDCLLMVPTYAFIVQYIFIEKKILHTIFAYSIHLEIIRIARLPRCCSTLKIGAQYFNLSSTVTGMLIVVYKYFMIVIWLYEFAYYLDRFLMQYILYRPTRLANTPKLQGSLAFTCLFLHITDGLTDADHPIEILHSIVFIGISYGLTLALYCQIFQEFQKFTNVRRQNEILYRHFSVFAQLKDLPRAIAEKIMQLFHFKYENKFFNETKINQILSEHLKQEVQLQIAKEHLRKVDFLSDIPPIVLAQLVTRMKSDVYLSNEVILTADVPGSCMYFIDYGTVAVYTPSGKEICHLKDGDHFGEIALIFEEHRTATVVAVTHCELFVLKRSDFIEVINMYPKVMKKIIRLASQRLRMSKEEDPTEIKNIGID